MRFALVIWMLVGGCGRLGFDALGSDDATDATVPIDGAGATDSAMPDAKPLGDFGPTSPIEELNSGSLDEDPSLSVDLLEIVFSSQRPGGAGANDLWTATRASVDDLWGTPVNVTELNTAQLETSPALSPDGLTLFFARGPNGQRDIFSAERASRGAPWSAPAVIAELSSGADESAPSADSSLLHVTLYSDASGNDDLYAASRTDVASPFDPPSAIGETNTPSADLVPMLSADGLTVYFASDRPGGVGQRDLYQAKRSSPTAPFGQVEPIPGVNTTASETDPWVSPDGRVIVFASGGASGGDLFIATR